MYNRLKVPNYTIFGGVYIIDIQIHIYRYRYHIKVNFDDVTAIGVNYSITSFGDLYVIYVPGIKDLLK